jgi:hypothetical protein
MHLLQLAQAIVGVAFMPDALDEAASKKKTTDQPPSD